MAQRNREFELKLSLPPDEFDGLVANPRLMGNGGEPSQKALRSIYYDTPDLRLRNEGLTLRVRHDGERYVQTIKAETRLRNGFSNPIEVEDRVEGSEPDLDHISDSRIRRKLQKAVQSLVLTPVFETAISRTSYHLRRRGSLIELALGKGEVRAKTRRSEICEAELELLKGNPKQLLETAQALFSKTNVYPSSISKAERGYSLLLKKRSNGKIEPAYAKKPNVKPGQTCGEAFAEILRSAGEQIIKNRFVVLKTDEAEVAHQMRVGLTRLRSALRALRPLIASPLLLKLETDAQRISRAVGELRDADVLIEDIYAPVARKFSVTPGFDQLYQTLQSHRSTMQRKARQSLSSENWSRLWNQLGSRVIRGNLLAIPIENSILYVSPLYLRAETGQLPELKRVIAAYGDRVVMEETLPAALAALFKESAPASLLPRPPDASGPLVPADLQAREALGHYDRAIARLKAGDWGGFGAELDAMRPLLLQLSQHPSDR